MILIYDIIIMIAHRLPHLFEFAGSPSSVKRGSPVSVYLFPGEGPKSSSSGLEGVESELDQLVVTGTEVHADRMSEECSEGSTDNDDFCILEAPGIGIPVSAFFSIYTLLGLSSICSLWHLQCNGQIQVVHGISVYFVLCNVSRQV